MKVLLLACEIFEVKMRGGALSSTVHPLLVHPKHSLREFVSPLCSSLGWREILAGTQVQVTKRLMFGRIVIMPVTDTAVWMTKLSSLRWWTSHTQETCSQVLRELHKQD